MNLNTETSTSEVANQEQVQRNTPPINTKQLVTPVQPAPSIPLQPIQNSFEIKPAGAWSRFWASVIDNMVLSLPVVIIAFVWSLTTKTNITLGNIENNNIFTIIFLLCYFPYFIYLTASKGATVGKDAYGLKVVKSGTDQYITYVQSAIRELVKFGLMIIPLLGGLFYLINGLMIIFSKQKRGIHDRAVNSQVLRVKPAWKMGKQILFFGGFILLGIIILTFSPQFFST